MCGVGAVVSPRSNFGGRFEVGLTAVRLYAADMGVLRIVMCYAARVDEAQRAEMNETYSRNNKMRRVERTFAAAEEAALGISRAAIG